MMKKLINWIALAAIVVGVGVAPDNAPNATIAHVLAQRAAKIDVARQAAEGGYHKATIIKIEWSEDARTCTMTADVQ